MSALECRGFFIQNFPRSISSICVVVATTAIYSFSEDILNLFNINTCCCHFFIVSIKWLEVPDVHTSVGEVLSH